MYDQLITRPVAICASDYTALRQEFAARHEKIIEVRGGSILGNSKSGIILNIKYPDNEGGVFKLSANLNPRSYTFGHNHVNASVIELSDFLEAVQKTLPSDISIKELRFTKLEYGVLIHRPNLFMWPIIGRYKDAPAKPMYPKIKRKNEQYGVCFEVGDTTVKAYDKQLQSEIMSNIQIPPIENLEVRWEKVVNASFPFPNFMLADIVAPNVLEKLSNHILTTFNHMTLNPNKIDLSILDSESALIEEYVCSYLLRGKDYLKKLGKDKKTAVRKAARKISQNSLNLSENRIKIEEALKPYIPTNSK